MMADPIDRFESLLARDGVTRGKIFGMSSLMINGNAALSVTGNGISYKLDQAGIVKALEIDGAGHYVPFGKGPVMREWVEIPFDSDADWIGLAEDALAFVAILPPKKTKAKKTKAKKTKAKK